ncbi:hypothetical protein Gotur_011578 [Gossypium turneri]
MKTTGSYLSEIEVVNKLMSAFLASSSTHSLSFALVAFRLFWNFSLLWENLGAFRSESEITVGDFVIVRLNSTVVDESKWSAHLQQSESPSMAMTENGNAEGDLGFKIGGHLADLEREVLMKKICVEDLHRLHHCVLHLENHPLKAPSTKSEL